MYRFLLSPRWLAGLALTVVVVVLFVVLGFWQLGRLQAGDTGDAAGTEPVADGAVPVPLEVLTDTGLDLRRDAGGRLVRVQGRYVAESQVLVPDQELDGRTGLLVQTPLLVEDVADSRPGARLVVTRGWVADTGDPGTEVPEGAVTVVGRLHAPEAVPGLAPLPPGSGEPTYAAQLVLIEQTPSAQAAPAPVPGPVYSGGRGGAPFSNAGYALQWWFFAGAALFFWAVQARAEARRRRAAGDLA